MRRPICTPLFLTIRDDDYFSHCGKKRPTPADYAFRTRLHFGAHLHDSLLTFLASRRNGQNLTQPQKYHGKTVNMDRLM